MEREIARAKRTKQSLTLAFVDVDDLKRTNDSLGHAAGDHVLRVTADSLRACVRSYDLVIRLGGDEFLCALIGMTLPQAAQRLVLVNMDLAASQRASITFGLAELGAEDTLEDLIGRADKAMYEERQRTRPARP